jgi:hypothetical protein
MRRSVLKVLTLLFALTCVPRAASATTIDIGLLTFDADVLTSGSLTFDITDLTGLNAFPPDFPITTPLTITVTNLTANKSGGGTLTIPGSDFTGGGDVQCSVAGDAASGGCNFAAYTLSSATLMGTLSPTTGLAGLPAGFNGIQNTFTATLLPSSGPTLSANDAVDIQATLVTATPVPEPPTGMLLDIGLIGLFVAYKLNRIPELSKRLRMPRA